MPGYSSPMDAVWLDVPEGFLDERRQNGHDKKDELWEGVLHMVPCPTPAHNLVAVSIYNALVRFGGKRGLTAFPDSTAIYAPDRDPVSWRVPDASLVRPAQVSERGLEGAVLAVEVRSVGDESYQKLPFYARVGVLEVWIVDPKTRTPEIFTIVDRAFVQSPSVAGVHRSPLLDLALSVVAGPLLRISDGVDAIEL